MNSSLVLSFVLAGSLLLSSAAAPAISLRCGTYLISAGDTKSKVLKRCGSPSSIESWEEELIKRDFFKQIPAERDEDLSREPFLAKETVKIEVWEYNFGSTMFIYYLRFENGKLRKITTGDYGY